MACTVSEIRQRSSVVLMHAFHVAVPCSPSFAGTCLPPGPDCTEVYCNSVSWVCTALRSRAITANVPITLTVLPYALATGPLILQETIFWVSVNRLPCSVALG